MKLEDINEIYRELHSLEEIALQQPYELATKLKIHLAKISPILTQEENRMKEYKLKVDCPQINVINVKNVTPEKEQEAYKLLDEKIQELTLQNFEIIDFGLLYKDKTTLQLFVKYRS